jgi:hypothetical protein
MVGKVVIPPVAALFDDQLRGLELLLRNHLVNNVTATANKTAASAKRFELWRECDAVVCTVRERVFVNEMHSSNEMFISSRGICRALAVAREQ